MKTILSLLVLVTACATAQPKKCVVSGCNGELCSESGKQLISPCVVLPHHECLKKSRCEVQSSNKCGWTPTPEYLECMKKFKIQ